MGWAWLLGACLLGTAAVLMHAPARSDPIPPSALVRHGEYVLRAAGCVSCHTDADHGGAFLAGGRALATPFGVFHTPNITSDPVHGIGAWSLADFTRALREGVGPNGIHYYPVFPYPSFTHINDEDIGALFAYLRQTRPSAQPNRPHELPWWMRFRITNRIWNLLFFEPGPYQPDRARTPRWNRGAYLVNALAHCTECHTPRNRLGALRQDRELAGTVEGPEDTVVPNITRDAQTGIGDWTRSELETYLTLGEIEDGPYADGLMAEVIEDGLQYLSKDDIDAIVTYVWSLPARRNEAVAKKR